MRLDPGHPSWRFLKESQTFEHKSINLVSVFRIRVSDRNPSIKNPKNEKILDFFNCFMIFIDLLSSKTDVNVVPKVSSKQKNAGKKLIFCWHLKATDENAGSGSRARSGHNPVYGSKNLDPSQNVTVIHEVTKVDTRAKVTEKF